MKSVVLLYPGYVDFEVMFAAQFLKSKGNEVITAALEDGVFTTHAGFRTVPHTTLDKLNPEDIDFFILPGGYPDPILGRPQLNQFLKELNKRSKTIAAICAAPIHLAEAGLLDGKEFTTSFNPQEHPQFSKGLFVDEDVVITENIITAKGGAYLEFAVALAQKAGLVETEEQALALLKSYKNIR